MIMIDAEAIKARHPNWPMNLPLSSGMGRSAFGVRRSAVGDRRQRSAVVAVVVPVWSVVAKKSRLRTRTARRRTLNAETPNAER